MKLVLTSACLTFAIGDPSWAMTGAELMQAPRDVGIGYVLGAMEYRGTILNSNDKKQWAIQSCINNAKMTDDTLYAIVIEHIKRNPGEISTPATISVLKTLNEICNVN
ncbi:hypothetical protein [Rhizobium johnstonii]|uniref:hypothetical protein n=1 Tax=Rhizobium johnstonii TaxID=3019933 RepID=UPI003F9C0F86